MQVLCLSARFRGAASRRALAGLLLCVLSRGCVYYSTWGLFKDISPHMLLKRQSHAGALTLGALLRLGLRLGVRSCVDESVLVSLNTQIGTDSRRSASRRALPLGALLRLGLPWHLQFVPVQLEFVPS